MGSLSGPSYDVCMESVSVMSVGHIKKKRRNFHSVDITNSCGNSPDLLFKQNLETNRSDSHLSRLTRSIKCIMQERGLAEKYFPEETVAASGAEVTVTSTGGYHKVLGSEVSLAETTDSNYTQSTARGVDDRSPYQTHENLAMGVKYDYSPEKANLWKELTNIDVSPVLPQRKSRTFCESAREVLRKIDPSFVQRNPLPQELSNSSTVCKKETKDPDQESIQFKFQYLIVTERLKVTVISASNMLKSKKLDGEAYTYAEVCLMPGKIQRQLSKLTKVSSSDTVFDFVAYFQGLSLFEMHQMCLRIKIMGKERRLKTPRVIGEVTVSLDDFDLVSETTLDESFNTRIGTRSGSRYGQRSVLVQ